MGTQRRRDWEGVCPLPVPTPRGMAAEGGGGSFYRRLLQDASAGILNSGVGGCAMTPMHLANQGLDASVIMLSLVLFACTMCRQ